MRRDGFVLIAVLIVTLLASMVAAGLLYRMHAETAVTAALSQGEQAYAAALSGLHTALALLTTPPTGAQAPADPAETSNAAPQQPPLFLADMERWHDNPQILRDRLVTHDGANAWYFTIYAQNFEDEKNARYGLIDESGKLNINSASEAALAALPGMTPQLLDALIDYRDRDSETRPEGAEQDYYDRLPQPYLIKNGPLATLDELMLIKGFTARQVYGEDANLNGLLDPNEDDGDEVFPPDNRDGTLDPGLGAYVTTLSTSPDLDEQGNPKINLNSAAEEQLAELGLSAETIQFIMLYRAEGNSFRHPSQLLEMDYTVRGRQQGRGGRGGRGRDGQGGESSGGGPPAGTVLSSGVGAADLPLIMSKLTTRNARQPQVGLVNVNTAPPAVLATLPGTDPGLADQIVSARRSLDADTRASTAWLYTQGLLNADQFKAVAPSLSVRGYQYRLRCVGYGLPCGRYRVIEAVVDLTAPSKVLYLRDITRLGLPLKLGESTEQ